MTLSDAIGWIVLRAWCDMIAARTNEEIRNPAPFIVERIWAVKALRRDLCDRAFGPEVNVGWRARA